MAYFGQHPKKRYFELPDQYLATIMTATTRNAAIIESARSKFFDRRAAGAASIGGITQLPALAYFYFRGLPRFAKINP